MTRAKKFLTLSKNGRRVFFNDVDSHVATHFADTPQLRALAAEVIAGRELSDTIVEFETDMGRIVGKSDLVENDRQDEIVYAKRKNREVFTVFNKSKSPQPCSLVTVSLHQQADGSYELLSAWIGPLNSPPFPGDENETAESKSFWTTHSLAWGTQEIQPQTETSQCPW